ncbi:uncharacterized protein LOC110272255 isoform X2 [Arachis ipaensis]|uniref:uncharacterized protein LOC110272255 isoform X2 n=1 Tax=Arachis ipaensis TaxID=130454 RepID=UPI000A2B764C|nr:uncharacterized protein LOC110272255 isoform X2 [Arachis ipaensis]XP_025631137.1 uncharacterized protein LOC112724060 isoform X2 [Arachis hypogaea]QHO20783.1 uncharacterized protein DS421_11g340960 [Arachis hypogaea]
MVTIMLSLRFTTILLITFILLPLTFSTAHQVSSSVKKTLVVAAGSMLENARSPPNVEIGVAAVGESDKSTRLIILGRKMMMSRNLSSSSIKPKKRCVLAKCNNQQQEVVGKANNSLNTKENDGFIPLNADYFVPRPHPPKNN